MTEPLQTIDTCLLHDVGGGEDVPNLMSPEGLNWLERNIFTECHKYAVGTFESCQRGAAAARSIANAAIYDAQRDRSANEKLVRP